MHFLSVCYEFFSRNISVILYYEMCSFTTTGQKQYHLTALSSLLKFMPKQVLVTELPAVRRSCYLCVNPFCMCERKKLYFFFLPQMYNTTYIRYKRCVLPLCSMESVKIIINYNSANKREVEVHLFGK